MGAISLIFAATRLALRDHRQAAKQGVLLLLNGLDDQRLIQSPQQDDRWRVHPVAKSDIAKSVVCGDEDARRPDGEIRDFKIIRAAVIRRYECDVMACARQRIRDLARDAFVYQEPHSLGRRQDIASHHVRGEGQRSRHIAR